MHFRQSHWKKQVRGAIKYFGYDICGSRYLDNFESNPGMTYSIIKEKSKEEGQHAFSFCWVIHFTKESNTVCPLFAALTFCSAAIGVAVGYIVGGQTLALFVDIDKVDISRYWNGIRCLAHFRTWCLRQSGSSYRKHTQVVNGGLSTLIEKEYLSYCRKTKRALYKTLSTHASCKIANPTPLYYSGSMYNCDIFDLSKAGLNTGFNPFFILYEFTYQIYHNKRKGTKYDSVLWREPYTIRKFSNRLTTQNATKKKKPSITQR